MGKVTLIPPGLKLHDFEAIRAWSVGSANAEQQVRAFELVIKKFCNIGGSYFDGEATHTFAHGEGRRSVAIALLAAIQNPIAINNQGEN